MEEKCDVKIGEVVYHLTNNQVKYVVINYMSEHEVTCRRVNGEGVVVEVKFYVFELSKTRVRGLGSFC